MRKVWLPPRYQSGLGFRGFGFQGEEEEEEGLPLENLTLKSNLHFQREKRGKEGKKGKKGEKRPEAAATPQRVPRVDDE